MSDAPLPVGTVFAGRYRVLEQIGSGGFGAVYRAVHVVTERKVAVKALWPHFAKEPEFRSRFLRESRLAAQVGSEFIVDVLDAGIDERTDTPFLVMELLEGESLNTRLARKRRLTPDETSVYLSQMAVALDRTHSLGIVHRDLKPANLFLAQRGDGSPLVKILDFGIAKVLESSALEASHTLGTPLYMAPEQFKQTAITPAVDVYALGLIGFLFVVGTHYFKLEQSQVQNVYALAGILSQGPTEAATLRAQRYGVSLPPAFDAWFARTCNVTPSERPRSAGDAVRELCAALGVAPRGPLLQPGLKPMTGALSVAVESPFEAVPSAAGTAPVGPPPRVTQASPTVDHVESRRPAVAPTLAATEAQLMPTAPITLNTVPSVTELGIAPPMSSSAPSVTPSAALFSAPPPTLRPRTGRAVLLVSLALGVLGLAGIVGAAIVMARHDDAPGATPSATEPAALVVASAPPASPPAAPPASVAPSPTAPVTAARPAAARTEAKAVPAKSPEPAAAKPAPAIPTTKPDADLYTRE